MTQRTQGFVVADTDDGPLTVADIRRLIHVKMCFGMEGEREILVNLMRLRAGLPRAYCQRFTQVPGVYV